MPHPPNKNKFMYLMQALQEEFDLLHMAFASAQQHTALGQTWDIRPVTPKLPTLQTPTGQENYPFRIDAGNLNALAGGSTDQPTHDVERYESTFVQSELDSEKLKVQSTESEPARATNSVEIDANRIEQLRQEFDKLDTSHEDRISLRKVVNLVEEYSDVPVQGETVYAVLREICDITSPKRKQAMMSLTMSQAARNGVDTSMHSVETEPGEYMTFDNFLYLMTVPTNSKLETDNVGFASLKRVQTAFHSFGKIQKELEEKNAIQRAKHKRIMVLLDLVPAPVILLNSLVMGFQADSPNSSVWQVFDISFFVFYVLEAIVKSWVLTCRVYLLGPELGWNWFDLGCIFISAFDIAWENLLPLINPDFKSASVGELMLMKMMRLAKLARLVKALHYPFFKELKLMISGVVSGMRVLLWAIVLLGVVIFFIGVISKNLIDHEAEFSTVPGAMFTIFRCFTDGCAAYDGTPLSERLRADYGALFMIPYIATFMFVTFGLFNLIMAIFISNVVSTEEKRLQIDLGLSTDEKRRKFEALFAKLIIIRKPHGKRLHLLDPVLRRELEQLYNEDVHAAYNRLPTDLAINSKVFASWMKDEELKHLLEEAEIQTSNSHELFDVLDADLSGELTVIELVNGLMRLRGPMTKADMIAVRMQVQCITQEVQRMCQKLCPPTPRMTNRVITHDGLSTHLRKTFRADSSTSRTS